MFANLVIGMLIISLLLFGTFYEFVGTIMLVIASGTLMFFLARRRKIKIQVNAGGILAITFTILYLISSIYAVDSGMAILGAIKNLWIIPALLCFAALDTDEKNKVFDCLPWFGSTTSLIGVVSIAIPALRRIFYSSNRFGGFFTYANTLAIFLLLCITWMCYKKEMKVVDYIRYGLMMAGIGLTGCRTAVVLAVFAVIFLMTRKKKLAFTIVSIAILLVGVFAVDISAGALGMSRLLDLSLSESTFVGRLLYANDALPLIASHPFGMGYMGFYYIQDSIQTGLYNVPFVHNDVLQFGLDIGIIPMVLYVGIVVYSIITKQLTSDKKLMLTVLFLHGLFDYDLSFGSLLLILYMILWDVKLGKKEVICNDNRASERVLMASGGIFILLGIYLSIALTSNYLGNARLAVEMLPNLTSAKLTLLDKSDSDEEIHALSQEIIEQNHTCSLAYYKAACVAQKNGDYDEMIRLERLAIANNHLRQIEYDKYVELLYYSILEADDEGKRLCAAEMNRIEGYMKDAMNSVSDLGKRINEQPRLHIRQTTREVLDDLAQRGYL